MSDYLKYNIKNHACLIECSLYNSTNKHGQFRIVSRWHSSKAFESLCTINISTDIYCLCCLFIVILKMRVDKFKIHIDWQKLRDDVWWKRIVIFKEEWTNLGHEGYFEGGKERTWEHDVVRQWLVMLYLLAGSFRCWTHFSRRNRHCT